MKSLHFFLLYLLGVILISHTELLAQNEPGRITYNFNPGWQVKQVDNDQAKNVEFSDQDWKQVTLPHAWNEDYAFRVGIKELPTGIAWYRKHFKIPEKHAGQKVFIEFQGVRQAAVVYVNGKCVGLHENGVTAFGFDITDHVHTGGQENVIAVKTNNSWDYKEKATGTPFRWHDKNFNANYGGIVKNVKLHITNPLYQTLPLFTNLGTTGQYIYAKNIDVEEKKADVHVESQVKNEQAQTQTIQFEAQIHNMEGELVNTLSGGSYQIKPGETKILKASTTMENLNLWSWGYGYLYTVNTLLKQDNEVIDQVSTRTGFRKTEFGNGLIKINDRTMMVKGYGQRTTNEWPALGNAVPPWMSDYSNKLMVESNANLVRWMHTTPSKQNVKSCDRVGIMQAMPAGDSEGDSKGRNWQQREEVMRDAIIYNRNHPSIIFYEGGNEGISEAHMKDIKALRNKYDPHGGRAAGAREMLDSEEAEYGGEMLYINKSNDKPVWATEYMRDEALRKYWDEYSPPYHQNGEGPDYKGSSGKAYNQNQDSYTENVVSRWYDYYRERPGTSKWVSSGGVNIIFSGTNTHYRGTENYRRSGEVDPLRIPKDGFYAHKIMWDGWVEPDSTGTHIVGHWNYVAGTHKDVDVVSAGEKVELFLNGKSLGYGKQSDRFLFTFDSVSWKPGTLKAVSYNEKGEKISTAADSTAGFPAGIRLSRVESPNEMYANNHDIAIVEVEVVDEEGQRCPTALNKIDFELQGPAEWRGGLAQGPGNYVLEKSLPVECGVNRVLIRSTNQAGTIKVKANAEDLESDSISFETQSVQVNNGLTTHDPAEKLPVNLEKGPTPDGPAYSVTSKTIEIAGANAGANEDKARLSYDGKQWTRWTNDGNIDNGWIEYEFEAPQEVHEISLKLSGWRTRRYPIIVTANDSVVYKGITETNLGYFYINPDKPFTTDQCKIRLFGKSEYEDSYKIDQLTGALDKETEGDDKVQVPTYLNIVDVEFKTKP